LRQGREITLLFAAVVQLFGAETMKVVKTNVNEIGEVLVKFFPGITWNQVLNAIQKCVAAPLIDDAIAVVQKHFPKLKVRRFPPSVKKGGQFDVPDGLIAHLTRECGGNVHDCKVVDVTCGSFEKETLGANPHSGAYENRPTCVAKNAADLETDSRFLSAYRKREEDIPHTRNNWVCYDFKERRIAPTHYTIRTYSVGPGHLKSWLIEISLDGKSWREVAREENNEQLKGKWFTATFAVSGAGECRFIRLVNIGRNHFRDDSLLISAWEIFGSLIE
jgi:hypothetical protein